MIGLLIAFALASSACQASPPVPPTRNPLVLASVQYGAPLRTFAGLSVFLPTAESGGFRRRGFIIDGGVGQAGARLSFGPAGILEYFESDVRGVVYRTWGEPRGATAKSTYAGVEIGVMIAYVRLSVGAAHRIAGPSGPPANVVSWSVGAQIPLKR